VKVYIYENQFLFSGFNMKSCDANYFLSDTEKGSLEFIFLGVAVISLFLSLSFSREL